MNYTETFDWKYVFSFMLNITLVHHITPIPKQAENEIFECDNNLDKRAKCTWILHGFQISSYEALNTSYIRRHEILQEIGRFLSIAW